jgi:hypothetical protein
VVGNQRGLEAADQRRDAIEMRLVQPVDRTEREADRVDGKRIVLAGEGAR